MSGCANYGHESFLVVIQIFNGDGIRIVENRRDFGKVYPMFLAIACVLTRIERDLHLLTQSGLVWVGFCTKAAAVRSGSR
ncbi:hypothetical protein [Halochromatium roseum]|uniref:hypothetical protein n=1 Tax=Halochromatium roseum TaxID=391920 RepID=UPI0019122F10|nr:hypothetical protein [Halochromatium roseum]